MQNYKSLHIYFFQSISVRDQSFDIWVDLATLLPCNNMFPFFTLLVLWSWGFEIFLSINFLTRLEMQFNIKLIVRLRKLFSHLSVFDYQEKVNLLLWRSHDWFQNQQMIFCSGFKFSLISTKIPATLFTIYREVWDGFIIKFLLFFLKWIKICQSRQSGGENSGRHSILVWSQSWHKRLSPGMIGQK